jgi:hypothetical protein
MEAMPPSETYVLTRATQPRRRHTSKSMPWKPQTLQRWPISLLVTGPSPSTWRWPHMYSVLFSRESFLTLTFTQSVDHSGMNHNGFPWSVFTPGRSHFWHWSSLLFDSWLIS